MESFRVEPAEQGTRLDRFLNARRADLSRSFVQILITQGDARVNDETSKPNYRVKVGDTISLEVPPPAPAQAQPEALPLEILYEDAQLLVINKAAGMVVHPAAGRATGTLVNAVLHHAPDMVTGNRERPGIVHRLDRDTSGVMLIAKNDAALHELQRQFAAREVEKTYLALVTGKVEPERGKIDAPLARDPRDRKKIAVAGGANARRAVTDFQVLTGNEQYTLLQVKPETGRTHQIRVHLKFIKHPVVADAVYGSRKNDLGLARQFLHAQRITFTHPDSGKVLTFSALLADDLKSALARAGLEAPLSNGE